LYKYKYNCVHNLRSIIYWHCSNKAYQLFKLNLIIVYYCYIIKQYFDWIKLYILDSEWAMNVSILQWCMFFILFLSVFTESSRTKCFHFQLSDYFGFWQKIVSSIHSFEKSILKIPSSFQKRQEKQTTI